MNAFYKYLINFFLIISSYTIYNIYKNENYDILSLYLYNLIILIKYILQILIIGFGYILYIYPDTNILGKIILLTYSTYKLYELKIPFFIFTGLKLLSIIFPNKKIEHNYNLRERSVTPPRRKKKI